MKMVISIQALFIILVNIDHFSFQIIQRFTQFFILLQLLIQFYLVLWIIILVALIIIILLKCYLKWLDRIFLPLM